MGIDQAANVTPTLMNVIVYDIGFSRFKAASILAHRARDEEIKNSELFVKI